MASASPDACIFTIMNKSKQTVRALLPDGHTVTMAGMHRLPTVVTHPYPGSTLTTSGYGASSIVMTAPPNASYGVNASSTMLDGCDVPRMYSPDGFDWTTFGIPGVIIDAYPAGEIRPRVIYKRAKDGRDYIAEIVLPTRHEYLDEGETVVRTTR